MAQPQPSGTQEIFNEFQDHLNQDHDLREQIREVTRDLGQVSRDITASLQAIHHPAPGVTWEDVYKSVEAMFSTAQDHYKTLAATVPDQQYYRYNDQWRFPTQRLSYLATLLIYLRDNRLASRNEVAALLGLHASRDLGFHLDLDDYLHGF